MGMKMGEVEKHLPKTEGVVRLSVALILFLSTCLVGFDSQYTTFAFTRKKFTFKVLRSLEIVMYIDAAAAAYNLLQLGALWFRVNQQKASKPLYITWLCYLLDQTVAYVVFAGTCAATENSGLVVSGSKELQWMKWCNKFTRLCFQAGAALFCSFVAAFLMALLSSLSAFNLFRFYSPKRFLLFKSSS